MTARDFAGVESGPARGNDLMIPDFFETAGLAPREVELAGLRPFWPQPPGRESGDLVESIAKWGLRRPLIAWSRDGGLWLLAGARRRAALERLGRVSAPALVLPPETPQEHALVLGLADNLERGLNPAETALNWRFLVETDEAIARRLAPLLALENSPRLAQWCLKAATLPEAGLLPLAEGRLDLENAARLADWEPADRAAALALFEALWPSKQKKREWLLWLEDIARRESLAPAEILAAPAIAAALETIERRGRPAVENEVRRLIWARRHPFLADLAARRAARLRALALPPAARLELDPTFEDLKFTLNLTFATPDDFRKLADLVARLADSPDFRHLLEGEGDD